MSDLSIESGERTFRITKYKDLEVIIYSIVDKDDVEILTSPGLWDLKEEERSSDSWIIDIKVKYQYEGIISPMGECLINGLMFCIRGAPADLF